MVVRPSSGWGGRWLIGGSRKPELLWGPGDAGHQVQGSDPERAHAENDQSPDRDGMHPIILWTSPRSRGRLTDRRPQLSDWLRPASQPVDCPRRRARHQPPEQGNEQASTPLGASPHVGWAASPYTSPAAFSTAGLWPSSWSNGSSSYSSTAAIRTCGATARSPSRDASG